MLMFIKSYRTYESRSAVDRKTGFSHLEKGPCSSARCKTRSSHSLVITMLSAAVLVTNMFMAKLGRYLCVTRDPDGRLRGLQCRHAG